MKTALALLLVTATIVAATWFVTRELRNQVSEQERRLKQQEALAAQLQKRPYFASHTIDMHLQNVHVGQMPIWIADSPISFAWLYFETLGDTEINKSVILTSLPQARAPIQLGPPFQVGSATDPACAWNFFLDGNKIMLDLRDNHCNVPVPAHVVFEGAMQLIEPTTGSR